MRVDTNHGPISEPPTSTLRRHGIHGHATSTSSTEGTSRSKLSLICQPEAVILRIYTLHHSIANASRIRRSTRSVEIWCYQNPTQECRKDWQRSMFGLARTMFSRPDIASKVRTMEVSVDRLYSPSSLRSTNRSDKHCARHMI